MCSEQIIKLLAARHSGDIFVPECKDGPFQSARMDAWVMLKSWAHAAAICYEIKVNRQDFLRDEKWRKYLPNCNQFYFAAPEGIIRDGELPPEAGLMLVSKNAGRLFMKRKSPFRDITLDIGVFRYILMWRAKIGGEFQNPQNRGGWSEWLKQKTEDRNYGQFTGKRIREEINKRILEVEIENLRLKKRSEHIEQILLPMLADLKLTRDTREWEILERRKKLLEAVPADMVDELRALRRSAVHFHRMIRALEANSKHDGPRI